jgi:general secretion pathway protein F
MMRAQPLPALVGLRAMMRDQMTRLVNALQPALILFMGVAVGGIIIVMLSAVFSMNTMDI